MLGRGDRIVSGRHQTQLRQAADLDAAVAWRHGPLNFDAMPRSEVLREGQRYSPMPVRFEIGQLDDLQVSGVFDIQRLDEMLSLLPRVLPVDIQRQADGGIMVSRR